MPTFLPLSKKENIAIRPKNSPYLRNLFSIYYSVIHHCCCPNTDYHLKFKMYIIKCELPGMGYGKAFSEFWSR